MKVWLLSVAVVALALASVRGAAAKTKCENGRDPKPYAKDKDAPDNCFWYDGDTCCTVEEANAVNSSLVIGTCSVSDNCEELANMLMCGAFCSPENGLFYQSDVVARKNGFKVCPAFAQRLYESCKKDEIPFAGNSDCRVLEENFENAEEWFDDPTMNGLVYHSEEGQTEECFNAAASLSVSAIATFALAAGATVLA